jgi:PAS domain S-box-containing protein
VLILAVFALLVAITGWRHYLRLKAAAIEAAAEQLNVVADLKVALLGQWRQERLADANLLLDYSASSSAILEFIQSPTNPAIRAALFARLSSFQKNTASSRIVLVDSSDNVLISCPRTNSWTSPWALKAAEQALAANQVLFSDLHLSPVTGQPNLSCAIPISDADTSTSSHPEGRCVFLLDIDPYDFLFPQLQVWPTPSRTAETMLVERQGDDIVYLNNLRHNPGLALRYRLPLTNQGNLPAAFAVRGNDGVVEGNDYRGQPVVAALRSIPGTPWHLIAKQDLAEIEAPLKKQAWLIIEVATALILAAVLGVSLVWRNREHQFSLQELAEQRRAENALRQSAERLAGFTAATFEGIGVSRDGRLLDVNEQYLSLFGYRRDEVLGQEIAPLVVAPESREVVLAAIRSNSEKRYEHVALRKDGTTFIAECQAKVSIWEGQPVRITAIRDITERKQAEAERERLLRELARKNKELEAVIYVSSHDLRSPLVNIQGFSHRLSDACNELQKHAAAPGETGRPAPALQPIIEGKMRPSLHYILASVVKMDSLLNGLLRLSRLGRDALEIHPLDMNQIAKSAAAALAFQTQQSGGTIEIQPLPPCLGDATQVAQVLSNLLDNALKYRHPERAPAITISGEQHGSRARYCVRDNGLGVPESHRDKIWEIFQRLDRSGTIKGEGLGLAIVRRILDRHDGRAWLECPAEGGSAFFFELPVPPEADGGASSTAN